jgi:hypothetical protein
MITSASPRLLSPAVTADPIVTANIYCKGRIDELLLDGVRGFRDDIHRSYQTDSVLLWSMRYRRGGEHLKVRVHAPDSLADTLRSMLTRHLEKFIASSDSVDGASGNLTGALDLPIDLNDACDSDYTDRQLLWTQYVRSHVSFGGNPFLDNDDYVRRFVTCLSSGTDLILTGLRLNAKKQISNISRQMLLWRLLLEMFAAFRMPKEEAAIYLSYHRDWLIRFTILKLGAESEKSTDVLASFNQHISRLEPPIRSTLRSMVKSVLDLDGCFAPSTHPSDWQSSLKQLADYLSTLVSDPIYHIDPHARKPQYAVWFKILHGTANQIGLLLLDEALAHHILLSCLDGD